MVNIYLDDCRKAPKGWLTATTVTELLSLMNQHKNIGWISLDNDLGAKYEGKDFVNMLINHQLDHKDDWTVQFINVHSQNTVAADYMYKTLLNAQKHGVINTKIYQNKALGDV